MLELGWQREKDFELFYSQWAAFIYNVAYRMCGNHIETEEIVQDTFIRVFRFVDRFRGGSLKSWLYRIVMNLSYTYLQRNKVRHLHEIPLDNEGEEKEDLFKDNFIDDTASPEQQIEKQEVTDKVQLALNSLPTEQKTVLILSDVEGLSYKEISTIVDCPVGTVRSRLARARKLFREALKHSRVKGKTSHVSG